MSYATPLTAAHKPHPLFLQSPYFHLTCNTNPITHLIAIYTLSSPITHAVATSIRSSKLCTHISEIKQMSIFFRKSWSKSWSNGKTPWIATQMPEKAWASTTACLGKWQMSLWTLNGPSLLFYASGVTGIQPCVFLDQMA